MKQRDSYEETKDSALDSDEVMMVSEPAVAYAYTEPSSARTGTFHIPADLDPHIGPYSMNEIEQQLQEADATLRDKSKWSSLSEILSDFKQEHQSWFR